MIDTRVVRGTLQCSNQCAVMARVSMQDKSEYGMSNGGLNNRREVVNRRSYDDMGRSIREEWLK